MRNGCVLGERRRRSWSLSIASAEMSTNTFVFAEYSLKSKICQILVIYGVDLTSWIMHGRLKVKSSEQQQAEKKAERAAKVKQYNEAIKQVQIFFMR